MLRGFEEWLTLEDAAHDISTELRRAAPRTTPPGIYAARSRQRTSSTARRLQSRNAWGITGRDRRLLGQPSTHYALKLAPYVFVRPGELRATEWSEFYLEHAVWRIPAERMRMGEIHIVPLAQQAVDILCAIQPLTGSGRFVFPSLRTMAGPISDGTMNPALRRLFFPKEDMTGLVDYQNYH